MPSEDHGVTLHVAQTNLSLYRQLHDAGYTHSDVIWVRDAYELAATLFAGQYRGSGKPFVAHLVGTASILAAIDAPPSAVVAGLMHAVYTHGDFGVARWRTRRARVRARIGVPAEDSSGVIAKCLGRSPKSKNSGPTRRDCRKWIDRSLLFDWQTNWKITSIFPCSIAMPPRTRSMMPATISSRWRIRSLVQC